MRKSFIAFFLLLFITGIPSEAALGEFKATFFDVGQGNCTLLALPLPDGSTQYILADCGTSSENKGESRKIDQIRKDVIAKIIKRISAVSADEEEMPTLDIVVSHADIDHYNLITDIIQAGRGSFNVGTVILGGEEDDWNTREAKKFKTSFAPSNLPIVANKNLADAKAAISKTYTAGDRIELISHPAGDSKNDRSLLVLITCNGKKLLLTGDIEGKGTDYIKGQSDISIKANVLQISHHGSNAENTNEKKWLEEVDSDVTVITTGWRYSHPQEEVIDRCNVLCAKKLSAPVLVGGIRKINPHPLTGFKSQKEDSLVLATDKEVLYTEARTTNLSKCPIYSTADVRDITVSWARDPNIKVSYTNRNVGSNNGDRSPVLRADDSRNKDNIPLTSPASSPRSPTIVSGLVSPGPSSPDPRRMESATLVTTAVTSPAQAKPRRPGLRSGTVGASANLGGGLS